MADPLANLVFLPWMRAGAAAGIQTPDNPDNLPGKGPAGVVTVTTRLQVNDAPPIERQVRLYGPGDVTGIDPQQVIRTEPRHLSQDFEPNYFPAIEFDRPDFPWLFTPASASNDGRLRPWLCLVVVRKQEGVTLHTGRELLLPQLEIKDKAHPAQELPNLAEAWAWAHAQVAGASLDDKALGRALGGDPALTLSRLLCPRRLDPATAYLACVVPAFDLGRKAGLGLPIGPDDEKTLKPAWLSGDQAPTAITLPVYYHWEFQTGSGGDFEKLVGLLEPRALPTAAGKRPLDISQPGFTIIPALPTPTILDLEGALRVPEAQIVEWPPEAQGLFQRALAPLLNAPWQALKEGLPDDTQEPLLGPPIYGCWQANQHTVALTPATPAALPTPPWLHELNLDPRYRAIAALGTQVVQAQQEQLMAAAWEQMGEIQRINQMKRQAQLARTVNGVYHTKHFANFSAERLLNVVAPAQARLVMQTPGLDQTKVRTMLAHTISQSAMPDRTISAPMRRLTNPRSVIGARVRAVGAPPIAIIASLNTASSLVPGQRKPAGWVTINQVSDQMPEGLRQNVRFERVSSALDSARLLSKFTVAIETNTATLLAALTDPEATKPAAKDSDGAAAFRQAAQAHQDYINQSVFRTIWQNYRFVFSGGNGIIYGVDHRGRLRFYRDLTPEKTGAMPTSLVIGQGDWRQFPFLFSGGDGIIYAVNQQGQLLFFRDKAQNGTGNVATSSVIGLGGWLQFKFIFSGGNGIIYAVETDGKLRFYRDEKRDGTNDIANHKFIAQSGWQDFKFVFSGGNGTLYAVDRQGRLRFARDTTQNGTKPVTEPAVISPGGWQDFAFVFAGDNGLIYAVDQLGRLLLTRHETLAGSGTVALPSLIDPGQSVSTPQPLDLPKTKAALLQTVNPATTLRARVQTSIKVGGSAQPVGESRALATNAPPTDDPLEPLQDAPVFPQPMYAALRDLSQDFLFPGLEQVPSNTITLLETNPQFVESFLVGLNAELSHELLWRGFPTNLRSTYFRQFWDAAIADIAAINAWGDARLGANAQAAASLVLLLRGELLRRYPNTVIYAVKADLIDGQLGLSRLPGHERPPLFRGTLQPDVTFLGFPLTRQEAIGAEAAGDHGWFFVIQQQPTEPRFGMDAPDFQQPLPVLKTWNDLNWHYLANTEAEFKALTHAALNPVPPPIAQLSSIDKAKWGKNAAHLAYITLQRPLRIAIHASQLLL